MEQAITVMTTTKDAKEARKIADALIDAGHAACVQILPKILSVYKWKDKKNADEEVLLLVKSTEAKFNDITMTIKGIHSYEVPEIIALPIVAGEPAYLEWITNSVR